MCTHPRGREHAATPRCGEIAAAWQAGVVPAAPDPAPRTAGRVVGLLLAGGAGRRMGGPKALVRDTHGTAWVVATSRRLRVAGCDRVRVVLGAEAARVAQLLTGEPVDVVVAGDWAEGMAASLRRGLHDLERVEPDASAALVHLVDLPDVGAPVIRRLHGFAAGGGVHVLARAAYDARPGHPVLLGRAHWAPVAAQASGDRGARDYLAAHGARTVECGDLATGADVDRRCGGRDAHG